MEQQQVICDNPRIVFNQACVDLLYRFKHFYHQGQERYWRGSKRWLYDRRLAYEFSPKRCGINKDNYQQSYVIAPDGEITPMYIAVPCGHCPNCDMSRQFSFVQRCMLETQSSPFKPWFVTLTYNDSNLPFDGELSVRDTQLFLKRFRINLSRFRDGKYDSRLRYAVCGEYGKKGRPHYHLILWNIPARNHFDFLAVRALLNRSWSKGWIYARVVSPAKNDHCFKYTMKYICKDSTRQHLPSPDSKKPFINSSRTKGLGGIGKPYLLEHLAEHIQLTFNTHAEYYNIWSESTVPLFYNSWVINTLFPSFSRLFPSYVRRALIELSYWDSSHPLFEVFRKYMFIPDGSLFANTDNFTYHSPYECNFVIFNWLTRHGLKTFSDIHDYLRNCQDLHNKREFFLYTLFSHVEPLDLMARSYRANKMIQRQSSLEQL